MLFQTPPATAPKYQVAGSPATPLTATTRTSDLLLTFSYVILALPYMYRAVDLFFAARGSNRPA